MSREYTVTGANQTVAGATTLFAIRPTTTTSIEILRLWVSQSANATSAQQRIQVATQAAALPTMTIGVTPQKIKPGDPVSGIVSGTAGAAGTSGINASAEGGGTRTVISDDAFNVLNGWLWVPTPRETIIIPASFASIFVIWFPTAPTTTSGWTFGCTFAELG